MAVIVLGILFALAALIALAVAKFFQPPGDRMIAVTAGVVCAGLAIVIPVLGMITFVSANTVGVVTSYGQYAGVVQSGPHMLAPWKQVEEFGTRMQPLNLENVPIKFSGNSGGDADLLVEWRIAGDDEAQIKGMWMDYRTLEGIQDRVVRSNTQLVLPVVMAAYTPGDGINGGNRIKINDATKDQLTERLKGTGVVIIRVTITRIDPDKASQDRIDKQVAAEADKTTAVTQADTARIRAGSDAARDKQLECLRIAETWDVRVRGPLPGAWTCGFGGPQALVGVR